jgi:hypothetical protein
MDAIDMEENAQFTRSLGEGHGIYYISYQSLLISRNWGLFSSSSSRSIAFPLK